MLGAVEGGGSKFLCAAGEGPDRLIHRARIATTTPVETLAAVAAFFREHPVDAVGVAMFGPLDLRPGPRQGTTLATPKPGWRDVPVRARLADGLGVPVHLDTDVNAAALAEQRLGAAQGDDPVVYVTVGTGVGGGVAVGGRPLHGLLHPEMGHLPVSPLDADPFAGRCPFHGRCLEGMISGPALAARLGGDPAALAHDDPALRLAARYLGRALAAVVLVLSPQRIVVGGGVGARLPLDVAARELSAALGGYLGRASLEEGYLRRTAFPDAGLVGAFLLAADAARAAAEG